LIKILVAAIVVVALVATGVVFGYLIAPSQLPEVTGAPASSDVELVSARLAQYRAEAAQYKGEADALRSLIMLLIGLGSLYAIALGVAQYVNAEQTAKRADQSINDAITRSEKSADRVAAMQAEIVRNYPMLHGLAGALTRIVAELNRRLADTEELDIVGAYKRLSTDDHFRILMLERLLPLYDHFVGPDADLSEMFRGVGRFYIGQHLDSSASQGVNVNAAAHARFYLERAIGFSEGNFAALNDLGFVLEEIGDIAEAERLYQRSLLQQPRQQRARYNLALLAYARKDFETGVNLVTEALTYENWQRAPSGRRVGDLYYNRACFRSRRGAETGQDHYADSAVQDLRDTSRFLTDEIRTNFSRDVGTGDLEWLNRVRPDQISEVRILFGVV
jgi:tetratricopeptide (TPR) repeat protein